MSATLVRKPKRLSTSDDVPFRVVLFAMTSRDYENLPETKQNVQLLDGEVVMSPRPRYEHQVFVGRLFGILDNWVTKHGLGRVVPDVDMELNPRWTPAPDLAFLSVEHIDRLRRGRIVGPADLVVEVISPSTENDDRVTKPAEYAKTGVNWYWLVDLVRAELEEYRRVRQRFTERKVFAFEKTFRPKLFPGLGIELSSMVS
jgi:Uma2 family endonuclease